jgi:hypothetical protein
MGGEYATCGFIPLPPVHMDRNKDLIAIAENQNENNVNTYKN